jgi:quercetin dioxygenase-like cupin family protein
VRALVGDIKVWPEPTTWRFAPERDASSSSRTPDNAQGYGEARRPSAPRDYHQLGVHEIRGGTAVIEGPPTEAVPFTFRLKFPPNYKIPAHWHPAIEHVTVISGTLNLGTGDKIDEAKTKSLSAGSVAIMQPKTNHFGWAKEETVVQVHGVGPWGLTYVNPADDPRKK